MRHATSVRIIGMALSAAPLLTGCFFVHRIKVTEEVRVQKPLAASASRVSVENPVGSVHVQTWEGGDVLVVAKKEGRGRSEEAARENLLRIEIDYRETAEGLAIVTRLPEDSFDGSVEFDLKIPARIRLEARVIVGGVTVENVQGGVDVEVITGGVKIHDVASPVRAKVVTGGVDVRLADVAAPVSIEIVTGGVVLTLPGDAGARLDLATVTGGISCGFDLPVSRKSFVGASASGAINGGGPDVHVRVTTGGIKVKAIPKV